MKWKRQVDKDNPDLGWREKTQKSRKEWENSLENILKNI